MAVQGTTIWSSTRMLYFLASLLSAALSACTQDFLSKADDLGSSLTYYGEEPVEHVHGGIITKETNFASELEVILANQTGEGAHGRHLAGCVYTNGRWVYDSKRPAYSPKCPWIRSAFRCSPNGRPDLNFEKYSWQPWGCTMPKFDIGHFSSMMKNKILLVVGDSFSRDFAEALVCEIATRHTVLPWSAGLGGQSVTGVVVPAFGAKIVTVVSPFVAEYSDQAAAFQKYGLRKNPGDDYLVWLDQVDPAWAQVLKYADVAVFMSGHWFQLRQGNTLVRQVSYVQGARPITSLSGIQAYRAAMKTVHAFVVNTIKYKGVPMWLTFSPSHYASRTDQTCNAQRPLSSITAFERSDISTSFVAAEKAALAGGPFRIVDVTKISDFRADAHVAQYYGAASNSKTKFDCTHWCLPGVPDIWTDIFQYVLLHEQTRAK